jgi:hypothetical protein
MAWRHYGGNKYGNHKVTVDGLTFDSKREAKRFLELKILEKAGKISGLQRQKKFLLIPAQYEPDIIGPRGGKKKGKLIEHECSYVADFVYFDEEEKDFVIEDTKGVRTPEYVIKRKLLLWLNGYRIREI